jgi:hypothetical protein
MPYSSYRSDLMGSATLTPNGSCEAGSLQSFGLVYVAGTFGIDDTGSIKIGFRFATDFGPVQFTDPFGQGFTTAEASKGATLELDGSTGEASSLEPIPLYRCDRPLSM